MAAERYTTYSFHTHSLALSSIEVICRPGQLLKVHTRRDVHFARVNLHDAGTGLLIGVGELNLPVQTTGSQQGRIQNVNTIGSSNDLANTII